MVRSDGADDSIASKSATGDSAAGDRAAVAGIPPAAVTVAVTTPLDTAHAPWPRGNGERLLFAQLYEPLVHLDCTGVIFPGVARSWSRDTTVSPAERAHTRWSFVLRGNARFTNGTPVRAADVVASWRASANAHTDEPIGSLISAIAAAARAVDDSTLTVVLPDSLADLRAFASPQLAIARTTPAGFSWPDGTTSYEVDSVPGIYSSAAPASATVTAEIGLRDQGAANPLLFRVQTGADGRDILDAGADVLITASAAAVQYAHTQPDRISLPLPWTRSYVLVLPARGGDQVTADCNAADLRPLREALALAVHVAARGARGPCWWESDATGGTTHGSSGAGSRRILYPTTDTTARELAERIVALAAPGRDEPATAALQRAVPELFATGSWNAAGMDSLHFAERLAHASDGAYILSLPREPAWPAAARAALLAAAPWLAPLGRTNALVPLVDTRQTLLIRRERGIPRMTILHDGTVIFGAPALEDTTSAP